MSLLGVYMYKLIICAILAGAFIYLGICISNNLKKKKQFWEEIVKLCDYMSCNIGFGQKKLNEIAMEFSSNVAKVSNDVVKTMSSEKDSSQKSPIKSIDMTSEENALIKEFFDGLGSMDSKSEIARIASYKARFESIEALYTERYKKFSPLIVKLCLIFGLMLCIVLI